MRHYPQVSIGRPASELGVTVTFIVVICRRSCTATASVAAQAQRGDADDVPDVGVFGALAVAQPVRTVQ